MPYDPSFTPLPRTGPGREGLPYRRCGRCDYNGGFAVHTQRHIEVADQSMCVDAGIADLVEQLWRLGVATTTSCQGDAHLPQPNPAEPYVVRPGRAHAAGFLPHVGLDTLGDLETFSRALLTTHGSATDEFAWRVRGGRPMTPATPGTWIVEARLYGPEPDSLSAGVCVFLAPGDVNYATELLARHAAAVPTAASLC